MKRSVAILILVIIAFIIYWITTNTNTIEKNKEYFTMLMGFQKPLTTYDDFGTFNFLLHTNDLPYYDPTYDRMSDIMIHKDRSKRIKNNIGEVPFNYSKDRYAQIESNNIMDDHTRIAPQAYNFYFDN